MQVGKTGPDQIRPDQGCVGTEVVSEQVKTILARPPNHGDKVAIPLTTLRLVTKQEEMKTEIFIFLKKEKEKDIPKINTSQKSIAVGPLYLTRELHRRSGLMTLRGLYFAASLRGQSDHLTPRKDMHPLHLLTPPDYSRQRVGPPNMLASQLHPVRGMEVSREQEDHLRGFNPDHRLVQKERERAREKEERKAGGRGGGKAEAEAVGSRRRLDTTVAQFIRG